jgi:hypothetical protein
MRSAPVDPTPAFEPGRPPATGDVGVRGLISAGRRHVRAAVDKAWLCSLATIGVAGAVRIGLEP